MKKYGMLILGLFIVGLFVCFWFWHSPLTGKITKEETNRYLEAIDKIPWPPGVKQEALIRLRIWAETDDGKPVYMLNLMRNYDKLRPYPGAPDFHGTPLESNKIYEKKGVPLLLKYHSYPTLFLRPPQGKNIVGFDPVMNDLSEILIVRYPNRRAFLAFLADPNYGPIMPYKLMAVELNLIPFTGEAFIPDLRLIVGGILLILFLAIGWRRAAVRPVDE